VTKKNNNDNPYQGSPLLGQRPNRRLTRDEVRERYAAIFLHYGISDFESDPKAIYKLVNFLLEAHVPGFQPKPPGGRPKKRSPFDVATLVIELLKYSHKTNAPLQTMLKEMSKDPWWAKNGFGKTKKDVLEAMRHETQELKNPEKLTPINKIIEEVELACLISMSQNLEEQHKVRDTYGEDSPEWRAVEEILRIIDSALARQRGERSASQKGRSDHPDQHARGSALPTCESHD